MSEFRSSEYWEQRYATGGNSGAGSRGRLAAFKAKFINSFVVENDLQSVIEFGCGDGGQLSLLNIPRYTGVDVSETILMRCRAQFPDPRYRFIGYNDLEAVPQADLVLSMDVVFHLVEDAVFHSYMKNCFNVNSKFVIFYSSNHDGSWSAQHVRHRCVTDYVRENFPAWSLKSYIPNIYPFDINRQDYTSFADFMVFSSGPQACRISIPAVE